SQFARRRRLPVFHGRLDATPLRVVLAIGFGDVVLILVVLIGVGAPRLLRPLILHRTGSTASGTALADGRVLLALLRLAGRGRLGLGTFAFTRGRTRCGLRLPLGGTAGRFAAALAGLARRVGLVGRT